ncbi:MAG: hypothetical protein WCF67_05265 [Chitinophagaceae bacterium]
MRKLLLSSAICILFAMQASSQRMVLPSTKVVAGYRPPANLYSPVVPGQGYVNGGDVQEQFMQGQWTIGSVKFKNGQKRENVWLVFNVQENKVYFRENNMTMEFVYPVEEFIIGVVIGADTIGVLYRSNYPAAGVHNDETFYEVMVDGKVQLLRCKAKSVGLYKDVSTPEPKRVTEKEQFFAFLPNGKIVKLKKNKEDILSALPEYADRINKIVRDKGLRLKTDEGLAELFGWLNES